MRIIINNIEECAYYFSLFNFKTFSIDVETNMQVRQDKLELTTISLYDGTNNYYIDIDKGMLEYIRTYFNAFINVSENTIICHNITFDTRVLTKYNISLENCQWIDTLVLCHLLDETKADKKLKTLAQEYLGKEVVKLEDISLPHDKTNELFVEYTLNDTLFTYELAEYFKPMVVQQGLIKLYTEIEAPFLKVLAQMELNGILVDKKKIKDTTKELQELKTQLELEMYNLLGIKYELQANLLSGEVKIVCKTNINSTQVLQKIMFEDLGLDIIDKSEKTGKPSTGKSTIAKLKSSHKFVELLDKYRKVQKLLTSFYEPLPEFIQEDGKVRPGYRDAGTRTGRLSCSEPNIQQLPKNNKELGINVRSCFVARPGYKLISCDYSGQELRVLAEVTNDQGLIDAFNSGKDFHQETADKFGVSRTQAKAISFGVAYRKSAYSFAKDWNCSEQEAQEYLDKYFSQFPNVKKCMEDADNFLKKNGYVTSIFGRRRRFIKSTDGKNFFYLRKDMREAFNFLVQSPSADMIRLASISTYKLSKEYPEWDLKQVASVHDENLYEVKEEYVDTAAKNIKKCFESVVDFKTPMIAEIGIGNNYGEAK